MMEIKILQENLIIEMMILLKEEERQLLGTIPGTTYRFMIAGELTEEEILDIANSIQPEKEE